MRTFCFMAWLALESGCSSYGVRCDSRLRPINPPGLGASASPTPAMPVDAHAQAARSPAPRDKSSGNP
jgi:hypothetical protein